MSTEPKRPSLPATPSAVFFMLAIDAILIVIFAIIGISSHEGDLGPANIARVAVPFLLPYLVLAATIKPTRLIHNIFPAGVALWVLTLILGPILRIVLFQDTSAPAFILVTAAVLGIFLLGRRSISTLVTRARKTPKLDLANHQGGPWLPHSL